MNTTANQISSIITTSNPSASYLTHALSELGNGNMQNGLKRMVDFFAKESASCMRIGRIQGGAIGFLSAVAVIGGVYIYHKWHEPEANRVKSEQIELLDAFQVEGTAPTEE